jgi:hypothetical protein
LQGVVGGGELACIDGPFVKDSVVEVIGPHCRSSTGNGLEQFAPQEHPH